MKKVATALILALASTTAIAGNQNEDYNACKATVVSTFPDYKKVTIKRMRSTSMNLFVRSSKMVIDLKFVVTERITRLH